MSITPQTRVALQLGTIIFCAIALVGAGWRAANTLGAIREELSAIRRDVSDLARDRWTIRDQERWAFELERRNRTLPIDVPPVATVRVDVKP